ncbi:MAG TPA: hypothetical protein VGI73_10395 [Solirubrobacterales bacterium]
MATDAVSPSRGPIQRRLLALLEEGVGSRSFATGLASRSSLGPCILTVRQHSPGEPDGGLAEAERWLAAQPEVEEVAAKNAHLHVRVTTAALRSWLSDAYADSGGATTEARVSTQVAVPREGRPCSLSCFRRIAVGYAVGPALSANGVAATVTSYDGEDVRVAAAATDAGGERMVEVAEVDARHDRLRARHGGVVTVEDLLDDLEGDAATQRWGESYPRALLHFLMTGVPRQKRMPLDDQGFRRREAELDEILAARELARAGGSAGADSSSQAEDDDCVRELIAGVESVDGMVGRTAHQLDPAPLNRLAGSMAQAVAGAESALQAGDPLWEASANALDRVLRVLNADVPDRGANTTALAA